MRSRKGLELIESMADRTRELAGRCAGRNQEEAGMIADSLAGLSDEWSRMEREVSSQRRELAAVGGEGWGGTKVELSNTPARVHSS